VILLIDLYEEAEDAQTKLSWQHSIKQVRRIDDRNGCEAIRGVGWNNVERRR
jgi:hypothetical protein